MRLSNAAVLLLSALQPALGKPANQRRIPDGTKNEIISLQLSTTETVIDFLAPNPGCAAGVKAWVGVWPADACNPYTADYKAWSYVEPTKGAPPRTVKFNNSELGIGEFKAAFVCEDGKRQPWMVSKTFDVEEAPPAKNGQCTYRSILNSKWEDFPCDKVKMDLCHDCSFNWNCEDCYECEKQCGQDN